MLQIVFLSQDKFSGNHWLVLHGNLSCSRVYNGCHTSFDKLLLTEKRAAHDGRLRGKDVRVTYQYHVDGALSTWPGLYITSARKLLTNRSYGVSYHLCSG